ncbi:MAG TPA: hypothetical protein VII92_10150 [Anaerolineae bacterium]
MIRAIIEGHKTQTRRIVSQSNLDQMERDTLKYGKADYGICPYGQRGDRLWVRETWAVFWTESEPYVDQSVWDVPHQIEYRADAQTKYPGEWPDYCGDDPECAKWRPSIHMPRSASRITLEVVRVRVERVQDITEEDAIAEGMQVAEGHMHAPLIPNAVMIPYTHRDAFNGLWDAINDKRGFGWDTNPWVWVIEFKREVP